MENGLKELWCLFNFVQPGLLGDLSYFESEFCKVIIKGGYTHADEMEKETSKICFHLKNDTLGGVQKNIFLTNKLNDDIFPLYWKLGDFLNPRINISTLYN